MTPDRFRACLSALDWSQRGLADYLGLASSTTVRDWARGKTSIPAAVSVWLDLLATHHDQHPLPAGWRRGLASSKQPPVPLGR